MKKLLAAACCASMLILVPACMDKDKGKKVTPKSDKAAQVQTKTTDNYERLLDNVKVEIKDVEETVEKEVLHEDEYQK